MLFMGEEWGASTPWQFFTSHPEPELGKATAEGRIAEFERMGWDPDVVPDPQDPETFRRSKLDWDELSAGRHARVLECYRRLGRLRRELPELTDPAFGSVSCTVEGRLFTMRRGDLLVVVNAGDDGRDDRGRGARGALRDPGRGRRTRRGAVGAGARRNPSRTGHNFLLTGRVSLVNGPHPGPHDGDRTMNRITALAATVALAAGSLALTAPTQAAPAKAQAYKVTAKANTRRRRRQGGHRQGQAGA